MNQLIERLQYVADQCADEKTKRKREQEQKAERELDDFTRMQKKIGNEIRETRKQIEERNQLLADVSNNSATARMSSDIRIHLRDILTQIGELKRIQEQEAADINKKKAKGKELKEGTEKEAEFRAEIVELCYKHIEECKNLEGKPYQANTFFDGYTKKEEQAVGHLPDVDDPKFQLLIHNDQEIDKKLDLIRQGVLTWGEMAHEMGNEIQVQGLMIEGLNKKADDTNRELNSLNRRLKKTLEKVRKADRFIIDIILLVIILAIGGYIYNTVKKS